MDLFQAQTFQPSLNVHRDDGCLIVEASMPGIKKDDVKLNVTGNRLTMSGEYRQENKDEVHTETRYGSFHRSLALPHEVNASQADARLEDGVLCIKIPLVNPKESEGTEIEVK